MRGMRKKSPKKITRKILPWVEPKTIDNTDSAVDKPGAAVPVSDPRLPVVPGAENKGHRRKGHDIVTAAILGGKSGGADGVLVAMTHLGLDALRDRIRKRYGSDVADIIESGINIVCDSSSKRRKRRKDRC